MRLTKIWILPVALIAVGGCAGQTGPSLQSDMDERTGVSLTRPAEPLRLAAAQPGLSDIGKDYLLTAPVTVTGMGPTQKYLWFGVGSSVDRRISGALVPQWKSIILVVDGVAMTFDLIAWSEAATSQPYDPTVKLLASYAAKVTDSQVRQISGANTLEAYVTDTSDRSPSYTLVSGDFQAWSQY